MVAAMAPLPTPAHAQALHHVPLHHLPLRRWARVLRIDATDAERARQLDEIGLRVGEAVRLVARAWPGGEPLAVQIGASRFALRRAEAACVWVRPEQPSKR